MKTFVNYYAVLGVPPGSTEPVMRKAYYGLARAHHDGGNYREGFAAVTEAWGVLKDRTARVRYDRERKLRGGLCATCNGSGLRAVGFRGDTVNCKTCTGTGVRAQ